jgi:hypothetical protein
LHGKLRKLFYAAVAGRHQALLTGTQRISEKICASVRFSAILCPTWVCGERHSVRWSAPPCDACQIATIHRAPVGIPSSLPILAHTATVRAGHHRTTGNCKSPRSGATWATSACSSLRLIGQRAGNSSKYMGNAQYGPQGEYTL